MESRRIIYYAGVGIITFATVIIACQGSKTKAIVIDPPASIAPMVHIEDDPESGGMPCVNPEQLQRFLNEQTASEESESRADRLGTLCEDSEAVQPVLETDPARMAESTEGAVNEPQASEDELEGVVLLPERGTEPDEGVPGAIQTEEETEASEEPQVVEAVDENPALDRDQVEGGAVCNGTPIYLCHGQMLSRELQEYAYQTCEQFGISFYYPHLICQMYQESGFRQSAVSPYGDYGLMQLKGIYHAYFKQLAGIPWADLINDPYANIYCGVALVAHYWNQCHDLNTTISAYNTGSVTTYNSAYVSQVRQHEQHLQRIR